MVRVNIADDSPFACARDASVATLSRRCGADYFRSFTSRHGAFVGRFCETANGVWLSRRTPQMPTGAICL